MVDYDIAVIGGGIQGAGCAQAGAAAGYSVCLLEKDTWGAATSGHSTKLIHGGLRYLETGQLGLIWKALRERRILLEIAAPLVRPIPFYIPVYEESRHRPWMIAAGLTVYRLLGGRTPLARFGRVPKGEWPLATGLRSEGLQKVYRYWEAQTDDRLLTRTVARSAGELGATLYEHALFLEARWEADRDRYRLSYRQNRKEAEISCRVLINAGGPWAGKVQAAIEAAPRPSALCCPVRHASLRNRGAVLCVGDFIQSFSPVTDANHHLAVALHAQTHRICRVLQSPTQALGAPVSESLQVYRLRRRTLPA